MCAEAFRRLAETERGSRQRGARALRDHLDARPPPGPRPDCNLMDRRPPARRGHRTAQSNVIRYVLSAAVARRRPGSQPATTRLGTGGNSTADDRHPRTRLRRTAARGRVRRGRPARHLRRRERRRASRAAPRRVLHRGHPVRAAAGGRSTGSSHHAERRLALGDAIVICVPTPLTANREPDLGPLMSAATELSHVLQRRPARRPRVDDLPGHDARAACCRCSRSPGLRAGARLPPRLLARARRPGPRGPHAAQHAEGHRRAHGACRRAREAALRRRLRRGRPRLRPKTAEMTKLLENIFRSVNIALVNELSILADRMGIDIREVVDAASTKPFGFMRFDPGPGMGGHCLPVDPFYLSWRAREFDLTTEFIELAGKVNQQMPVRLRREGRARAQRRRQAGPRLADRGPRRRLQAGRLRHPRVAGAEDHRAPAGARRRRASTTTRTCRSCRRSGSRACRSRTALDGRRRRGDRHGAPRGRPHDGRRGRPRRRPARRHARRQRAAGTTSRPHSRRPRVAARRSTEVAA